MRDLALRRVAGGTRLSVAVLPTTLAASAGAIPGDEVRRGRQAHNVAAAIALLCALWLLAQMAIPSIRVVMQARDLKIAVDAAYACAAFMAALVVALFPEPQAAQRHRWVAAGLIGLAVEAIAFEVVDPIVVKSYPSEMLLYLSLAGQTVAIGALAVGLHPRPVDFPPRRYVLVALGTLLVAGLLLGRVPSLPMLWNSHTALQPGLWFDARVTRLYRILALVPLVLAVIAAWGASQRGRSGTLARWIMLAMVLLAGAEAFAVLWPAASVTWFTSGDMLRLAVAAAVTFGAILDLRRVAAQRAALLLIEREQSQRQAELSQLKADFTAMVAHELGSPLATIRAYTSMIATGDLDSGATQEAADAIRGEVDLLVALVRDVRLASSVERDEFSSTLNPIPLRGIIDDAASFARALPGDHPIALVSHIDVTVLADEWRIAQVLRNLLSNAAKYSPDGTCIALRTVREGDHVRVLVEDQGYGISPEDMSRIFEKFGRGRDRSGKQVSGLGLGLYLSRRVIRAHGSDLTIESVPDQGSSFGFTLEVVE